MPAIGGTTIALLVGMIHSTGLKSLIFLLSFFPLTLFAQSQEQMDRIRQLLEGNPYLQIRIIESDTQVYEGIEKQWRGGDALKPTTNSSIWPKDYLLPHEVANPSLFKELTRWATRTPRPLSETKGLYATEDIKGTESFMKWVQEEPRLDRKGFLDSIEHLLRTLGPNLDHYIKQYHAKDARNFNQQPIRVEVEFFKIAGTMDAPDVLGEFHEHKIILTQGDRSYTQSSHSNLFLLPKPIQYRNSCKSIF